MLSNINNSKKSKIILRVFGGLGNQLFSYAAARRLAEVNNSELLINHISGFSLDKKYKRKYQLNNFSITCRKANYLERLEPFGQTRRYLYAKWNKSLPFEKKFFLTEEGLGFDPRLINLKVSNKLYIEGYWQSENYFKDIESIIRRDLVIDPPRDILNLKLSKIIESKIAVAVHIRFFQNFLDKNKYNKRYYDNAINIFNNRIKNVHFFIFSDHPKIAQKLISIPKDRFTLIGHNKGEENAYADLWLMSKCKHFIIANSTFSWWGAWLSNNSNKLIIAPKKIILSGEGAWGFKGMLPDSWLLI